MYNPWRGVKLTFFLIGSHRSNCYNGGYGLKELIFLDSHLFVKRSQHRLASMTCTHVFGDKPLGTSYIA